MATDTNTPHVPLLPPLTASAAAKMMDPLERQLREARTRTARAMGEAYEKSNYEAAQDAELRPKAAFDGLLRPAMPMRLETHRLLRAVAMKRAKKIPGELPSIGALIEELVEKHRPELEREAGALLKKEMSKKR